MIVGFAGSRCTGSSSAASFARESLIPPPGDMMSQCALTRTPNKCSTPPRTPSPLHFREPPLAVCEGRLAVCEGRLPVCEGPLSVCDGPLPVGYAQAAGHESPSVPSLVGNYW